MTATVVIGMHRSGTSLLAQLLHASGVHLGDETDLLGPAPDNEDGFWEHRGIVEVNDRLLEAAGWAWDRVPSPDVCRSARWDEPTRIKAKDLVGSLWGSGRPWGWKDPRATITLPFWRDLVDELRVVIALRDPLEVAASLLKRNGLPLEKGLALWRAYQEHAAAVTAGLPTLVVHFGELVAHPEQETRRLLEFAGLDQAASVVSAARAKPHLRHHHGGDGLVALQPGPILDLYEEWAALAGHRLVEARSEVRLETVVERVLHRRSAGRNPAVDDLEARVRQVQQQIGALARALVAGTAVNEYDGLRRLAPLVLHDALPLDSDVLVVSKGDPELLALPVARARHFPADAHGEFTGHHPATSLALIAQLEVARSTGATRLFLPNPYRWYLDHYAGFAAHLGVRYPAVFDDAGVGVVYAIAAPRSPEPTERAVGIISTIAAGLPADEPSVLDWADLTLVDKVDGVSVCTVSGDPQRLPYLDGSIDIVVRDERRPPEEAERVARAAVITVSPGDAVVEHKVAEVPTSSASVVIPAYNKAEMTLGCVRAVLETVEGADVEVIVVDDGSVDDTAARIERLGREDSRVLLVQNEQNSGFIASCNNGAAAATRESLVFLNNDTVPLPGWLPPLLQLLWSRDDVGAVGGMLLFADGTLQEAGGVIFRDGSGANVGRGCVHLDHPNFSFVREVDYCSGALLATRRRDFESLGGFDTHFAPAYYEDTDYCFRLRDRGQSTLYQPRSVIVHLEGATSGTDLSGGAKRYQLINRRRFVDRWQHVLRHRPSPPGSYGESTWNDLVGLRPFRSAS